MSKDNFGVTPQGEVLSLFRLTNSQGMAIVVSDLGAVLRNVLVPDKDGRIRDVVLGYETAEQYLKNTSTHFGATIGRSANRTEGAAFTLSGKTFQLPVNEGENNLHSGPDGYHLRQWQTQGIQAEQNQITFMLHSPDGDQGYPGSLELQVTYKLTDENEIAIIYEAIADADTIFNPTNHSYFNLAGHDGGPILTHRLTLSASSYTPVRDQASIPTGELLSVRGTPMDFLAGKEIGAEIDADFEQLKLTGGYDHNYVLDKPADRIGRAASIFCRDSGITMEVDTDLPGIQFYAGNFLDNEPGKRSVCYQKRCGFCLETQYFPNAVNTPGFLSPVLPAGRRCQTQTIYRFRSG